MVARSLRALNGFRMVPEEGLSDGAVRRGSPTGLSDTPALAATRSERRVGTVNDGSLELTRWPGCDAIAGVGRDLRCVLPEQARGKFFFDKPARIPL